MCHLPLDHPQHDLVMELACLLAPTPVPMADLAEGLGLTGPNAVCLVNDMLGQLRDAGAYIVKALDARDDAKSLAWIHPLSIDWIREHANAYWQLADAPAPDPAPA